MPPLIHRTQITLPGLPLLPLWYHILILSDTGLVWGDWYRQKIANLSKINYLIFVLWRVVFILLFNSSYCIFLSLKLLKNSSISD